MRPYRPRRGGQVRVVFHQRGSTHGTDRSYGQPSTKKESNTSQRNRHERDTLEWLGVLVYLTLYVAPYSTGTFYSEHDEKTTEYCQRHVPSKMEKLGQ